MQTPTTEKLVTVIMRVTPEAAAIVKRKSQKHGLKVPRAASDLILSGAKAEGFFLPETLNTVPLEQASTR